MASKSKEISEGGSGECDDGGSLLFIHEVDYLQKPIFEMHEFPEGLAERGWSVHFIDFVEQRQEWRPRQFVNRVGNSPISLRSVPSIGNGIFRRLIAVLIAMFWLPVQIARIRPTAVVLYAVPTFGWQTIIACRLLRIPTIYRAIDMSSDIRETAFRRLVAWSESYVARRSTAVCSNTFALGDHLEQYGAVGATQVFPGFDEQQLLPASNAGNKTILFMGTLFPFAGLEKFIHDASDRFRSQPEVIMRILGDGDAEVSIREAITQHSLGAQIELVGFVPYEQLFDEMKDATVAIIPFELMPLTHVALPGKVPQYLRAGLPVVSTPLKGLQELLPDDCGVRYREPGQRFVDEVWNLLDDPQSCSDLVKRGTERLNSVATWSTALDRFEQVITVAESRVRERSDA